MRMDSPLFSHKTFNFNKEKFQKIFWISPNKFTTSLSWNKVEKLINNEIKWLQSQISEYYSNSDQITKCGHCLLRKIAILIVSGRVQAKQVNNLDLNSEEQNSINIKEHGEKWHQKVMKSAYDFFSKKNYNVEVEPILVYGRADLGAFSRDPDKDNIYVEIGSVSFYKLWHNLSALKNINIMIIPSKNKAIILSS